MHEILITNDDGIQSPALSALALALAELGNITVVAPDREMSATSHGITLDAELRYQQISANRYSVQGTPADCVIVAGLKIFQKPPSLVVSGVNRGLNLGDDISYSGTVAAATEATLKGIPAIAVSTANLVDATAASQVAVRIAARVLASGLPPDVLLNVNCPINWNGEFRLTRQGRRGGITAAGELTDYQALEAGYVSICPLQINRTAHAYLEHFSSWFSPPLRGQQHTWLTCLNCG